MKTVESRNKHRQKHRPESHSIHINPKHEGLLHQELHVAAGKPIPESKIVAAEHSKNPAERRRAVFAENAKHFDHSKH